MLPIAPPQPLYQIWVQLLQQRKWYYLRYVHLRSALQRVPEVRSVLSLEAGRGLLEVALAYEHPNVEFTVTERQEAFGFSRARELVRELRLRNIRFRALDPLSPPWRFPRHDLVSAMGTLERLEDTIRTGTAIAGLSSRWVFCLVPFATDTENKDEARRARSLARYGRKHAGFDAPALMRLFPHPVAVRGCFWTSTGVRWRERLATMSLEGIAKDAPQLLIEAEADRRLGWPIRATEAMGIWILSEAGTAHSRASRALRAPASSKVQEPPTPREVIEASGLFDAEFYTTQYGREIPESTDPLTHYLTVGALRNFWPHPQFDAPLYSTLLAQRGDGVNPLLHYLSEERRAGFALRALSAGAPLAQVAPMAGLPTGEARAVGSSLPSSTDAERASPPSRLPSDPGEPASDGPAAASANAAPAAPALAAEVGVRKVIEDSGLFDPEFYLITYEDVRRKGVDPLAHYLRNGAREGRWPNRLFDPILYARGAGIELAKIDPLFHYITVGEASGIQPSAYFDPRAFEGSSADSRPLLAQYLEKVAVRQRDLAHALEARRASPGLSVNLARLKVTIIIPVYNGAEDLACCLASVLAETRLPHARLLIIDDASPDPRVRAILRSYEGIPGVTLLHNEENLGFTRTVNRGLVHSSGEDVVLLNADTVVGPMWLEQLALAAYSSPNTASATALSDNSGAFSTPKTGSNPTREVLDVASAARLSRRAAPAFTMEVPTGNGFCMYLRAEAVADVGVLDCGNFPRGYGEENDWCLRASERGWRHVIALHAYVAHVNAVSFGDAKERLCEEARQVLSRIHPSYSIQLGQAFSANSLLQEQRSTLNSFLLQPDKASVAPRILYVVSTSTGGTPQTNQDLMSGVRHLYAPFLLTCNSRLITLCDATREPPVEVDQYTLDETVRLLDHGSIEYDAVIEHWLRKYAIELVHVRHIGWHSLALPRIAKSLGIAVVFSFHDFYTVCPSVNLVEGHGAWQPTGIAEPHIVAPLWAGRDPDSVKAMQAMDGHAVLRSWRRRMNAMLEHCGAFVTTTPSAKRILQDALPYVRDRDEWFRVIPHGRDFDRFLLPASPPDPGKPMRLLVPGNINEAKGLVTLLRLAELDPEGRFEFHIVGNARQALREHPRMHWHGTYQRGEFFDLVQKIRPHVSLVLSIWPETFCHTLTESWAAGLPVIGSRLGAVGDRIQESGAGWIVDPMDARGIVMVLERIRNHPAEWRAKARMVQRWHQEVGTVRNIRAMATDYVDLYRDVLRAGRTFDGSRCALSSRIAVVARGSFPSVPGTAHIRVATPTRMASGAVRYEWTRAETLVREGVQGFDGVLVVREAAEARVLEDLARECTRTGVPLVLDLDDDVLAVPAEKDPLGRYERAASGVIAVLRSAAMVTVSTPELAETYGEREKKEVTVVPNGLDRSLWFDRVEPAPTAPPGWTKHARLRVLYYGTWTHGGDLSLILPVFRELKRQGIHLHVVGVDRSSGEEYARIAVPKGHDRYDRFVRWLRAIAPYFDVGVAPLVDSQFNRAKSPLKYMELSACGLPTVASHVVPYSRTIHHGEDGLLADTPRSWLTQLRRLLEEPQLGADLGRRAKSRAEREFVCTRCAFDEIPWRELRAPVPSTTVRSRGNSSSLATHGLSSSLNSPQEI